MLIYANVINRRNVCLPEHWPACCSSARTADIIHMNMFHHALPSKKPKWLQCFSFTSAATCSNHNISELSNRSLYFNTARSYTRRTPTRHTRYYVEMTHKNGISLGFTHKHGLNFPPLPRMTLPSSSKMSSASSRTSSFMLSSVMSGKAIPSYPLLLFSFA